MLLSARAIEMAHDKDPRRVIMDKIADALPDIRVMPYSLIAAVYQRPERTASGIYMPDKTREEENYQGKIGLIVKVGPYTFEDDSEHKWGDQPPQIGEWVVFRVGDTWSFHLKDITCRHISERNIRMVVPHPDLIY